MEINGRILKNPREACHYSVTFETPEGREVGIWNNSKKWLEKERDRLVSELKYTVINDVKLRHGIQDGFAFYPYKEV